MKAKLKRIMPVCFVVIFFIVALIAQHLPVSFGNVPYLPGPASIITVSENSGPNVTVINNENGTFSITGLDSSMMYYITNLKEEWTECPNGELVIDGDCDLFIKYKEDDDVNNWRILPLRNSEPAITLSWSLSEDTTTTKSIKLKTTKTTYIYWGDGFISVIGGYDEIQEVNHEYEASANTPTVKIIDNVITYFNCNDSGVTALDTTYNGKLTELHCSNNSISTLNLSKNTVLESLYCNNNLLSSLDLTNNVLLSKISCVQETGFDSGVSVINSQFSDTEIYSTTEAKESITESKALYKHEYTVVNRVPITIPPTPTVTAIKNDDGTYRLDGFDSTMEYNTKDPNATIWTSYSDENNLQSIKFNETYYIRVKAVENVNTVSLAQTVDVKVVKLEKTINADGSETARVDGMRTDMEYNDVSANYEGAWTPWEEPALQSITENITYHIRLIGGNHVVSLTVNVVERADAPSVTYEYNEDGSCKLVGIDTTMEYNTESPTSKNWTRYVENTLQNISETMVFYIRIAKNGETPSSKILQLTVNPRIMANVSIAQNPDGSYRIDGMTTEMEYNTISPIYEGQWTGWQEGDLQNITESVSYYIRVKEQTSVSVLNIYVITLQENEDRSINILGVTEKMEYNTVSRDYSEEWTAYTTDSLNNISENITYYIRVKSIDGAPVGQVIEVSVVIRPAAPDVQVVNNGDGTYSISPMTTDMEYNTESANYTGTWTRYVEGALDNRTESVTYYIRIAATETTPAGRVKALPVNVVTRPLAPSISYENNADGSIKLIGLDTTMEYNTESADYTGTWTRYVEGALNNITTSGTYYIRVAEDGDTLSGDVCSVVVTTSQPTTYTISYDVNGGNETIEAQTKTHGVDLTLSSTIPTKEGYTFLGWSTSSIATSSEYSAGGSFTVDANTTLYAVWEAESIADITTIPIGSYIAYQPSSTSCTVLATDSGYDTDQTYNPSSITSWKVFKNNSGQLDIISSESVGDLTLKGTTGYTKAVYTLNKMCSGYVNPTYSTSGRSLGYKAGSSMETIDTSTYPLEAGVSGFPYIDTYYKDDETIINSVVEGAYPLRHTGDGYLWYASRLKLTNAEGTDSYFDVHIGSSSGVIGGAGMYGAYADGSTRSSSGSHGVRPVISLKSGLNITGGLGTKNSPYVLTTATSPTPKYTISYDANGGNGVPSTQTKTHGEDLLLSSTIPTKDGYTFLGWSTERTATEATYSAGGTFPLNNDTTLYAVWVENTVTTYTITVVSGANGTIEPDGNIVVREGDSKNFVITPDEGYEVDYVKIDGSIIPGVTTGCNLTDIVSNQTVEVSFKLKTYTISYDTNGGNETIESQIKTHGEDLTLSTTVPTKEGYTFLGWATASTATEAEYGVGEIFAIDTDTTLYAVWEVNIVVPEITVVNNGDESYRLEGIDETMEYNTISADYTGRWTKYVSGKLQNITETITYYVRISATATEPASAVATVYVTPNAFTVTVTSSKNGKVTPNGTVVIPKGGSQEFKISANSGYKIADVLVDDESVGAVSSYKLTNVMKNHTIKVTFKKIADSSIGGGSTGGGISLPQGIITSSWKNKFTDVSKDDWYYEVVKFVNERKYFSGTSETTFSPDTPMTREMFMVALYNMDGKPITYGPNKYFDVAPGHWSEAAIVWGSAKGIIAGFPDGSFRPSEPVTRQQVATIMKKYAEYKYKYTLDRKELTSFNDHEDIYDWAYESISWAVAKGIIKGDNHNYILPHKSATRAEVAAMFMNYKRME